MKYQKSGATTQYAERPSIINWTKQNLPDAFNFFITDFDMVIRNRDGDLMIVEVKNQKAVMPKAQRTTYHIIDKLIRQALGGKNVGVIDVMGHRMKVQYHGFHVLTFEKNGFHDGKAYINGKLFSEQHIIELLSFQKTFKQIFNEREKMSSLKV